MNVDKRLFYSIFRLILSGHFVLILTSGSNAQTKTKQNPVYIEIYGGENGNLYTDGSNLISIITKDTIAKYTIKSSQGTVWGFGKTEFGSNMFFVDSLQKGRTTITVFRTLSGKDMLVKTKTYNVVVPRTITKYNSLSISPDISLGGYTTGKVKLDTLKQIHVLSINNNYTILNATIYIGQAEMQVRSIKSKYFDSGLVELWKRIMPGCTISIDNIEFMDKTGNRYYYPRPITVTAIE